MKSIWKFVIAATVILLVIQFVRPGIPSVPATAEFKGPPDVKRILEKDCYSCHSSELRLSWFDRIQPGYWIVRNDILNARAHLNFSTLGSASPAAQRASLFEAVNMIQLGAMPLSQFVALHPDAKVTPQELATLKAYLAPWGELPNLSTSTPKSGTNPLPAIGAENPNISLSSVEAERNGLQFDSSFENWKLLSTTDRGDNNTFRFILGNDIAVNAAQSGNISPWPDGTRFAKVAWQQCLGNDGLIHPCKFIQVELMVKDASRYKDTDGWGWGRWRGGDLTPYGEDAHFVNECTGCHLPMRGNDYVYTLPITRAPSKRNEVVNNAAASLPGDLPWQPFIWRAITMFVDPNSRETSILYGNDVAMRALPQRLDGMSSQSQLYPAGAVLALVTWTQRDDPHWFGGRIPDKPLSVEFIEISSDKKSNPYRIFTGESLVERRIDERAAAQRTSFILNLAPALFP